MAKAIRYHQKAIQTKYSVDPIDTTEFETQLWKAGLLTETLETLAEKSTKLPKPELYEVLTELVLNYYDTSLKLTLNSLTNARLVAEDYVGDHNGVYANRVKDNIKRIEKIEKLIENSN